MHHKRKKTKRRVKCTMCTPYRWRGNNSGRFKEKEQETIKQMKREMRE